MIKLTDMKAILRTLIVVLALFSGVESASAQPQGTVQLLPTDELSSAEFPEFDPSIAQENGYQVDLDEATGEYKLRSSMDAVWESILKLLERFLFNRLVSWLIVHFLYFRKNGRSDYYFTFLVFSSPCEPKSMMWLFASDTASTPLPVRIFTKSVFPRKRNVFCLFSINV